MRMVHGVFLKLNAIYGILHRGAKKNADMAEPTGSYRAWKR